VANLPAQQFKECALRQLPSAKGVYALCDLDEVPLYVGQSTDGIRARVRRHLTSARSDVIANRQIDVWEIAFVWAWPINGAEEIARLEGHLFHQFKRRGELVNGTIPPPRGNLGFDVPEQLRVQVIDDAEIVARRDPARRFPRQIEHFGALVDYILNTQDKPHLRRALDVYLRRLTKYHKSFTAD
jgi:hypothetical protein